MDFSANHQWLAELENEDLGELEFVDPLSMKQLAESLANELWDQPKQEPKLAESYASVFPTATTNACGGSNSNMMLSFADGSSRHLSFSAQEPKLESNAGTTAQKFCAPLMDKNWRGGQRASSRVHEHVVAERKRREKMHNQFTTLASIIPNITKADKVSVLGSAIEYVHHLQERVKTLQEEQRQSTAESPPLDARCCIGSEHDGGSPVIEADVRGTTVLLRVVCREKKGLLVMVLAELEKNGLSVVNANVVPLAETSLNITITAQIEDASSTTAELVKTINLALRSF